MKAKIIIIIILFMAAAIAVYGYFNAAPAPQEAGEKQSRIEISEPLFDFGAINYGDKVDHVFRLKNTGGAPLEIKKVATSCGCTSAAADKNILAPGEEADLTVTYDSGAMSGALATGEQERIIYVKTNDPASPMAEARIKAYVR